MEKRDLLISNLLVRVLKKQTLLRASGVRGRTRLQSVRGLDPQTVPMQLIRVWMCRALDLFLNLPSDISVNGPNSLPGLQPRSTPGMPEVSFYFAALVLCRA